MKMNVDHLTTSFFYNFDKNVDNIMKIKMIKNIQTSTNT